MTLQDSFGPLGDITLCSCDLFDEYFIRYSQVGNVTTRTKAKEPVAENSDTVTEEFTFPDTYVAVRPESGSDRFWVIKVVETNCVAGEDTVDGNGIKMPCNHSFMRGFCL